MPTPTLSAATSYNSSADALTHTFNHTAEIGDGLLVYVFTAGVGSAVTVTFGSQTLTLMRNEPCAWLTSALSVFRLATVATQGTQTVTVQVPGVTGRRVMAFVYNTRYVQSYDYLVLADDNVARTSHDLPAMTGTSNDRLLGVYVATNPIMANANWTAPNGTVLDQARFFQSNNYRYMAVIEETSTTDQVITGNTVNSVPATALGIRLTGVTQANFKRQFFPVN